jgi:hypothetical protein
MRAFEGGGLEPAMRTEFGENVLDVCPHGFRRNVHLAGHFPGALTPGNTHEHFRFPRRQGGQQIFAWLLSWFRRAGGGRGPGRGDHIKGGGNVVKFLIFTKNSRDADLLSS